jgi:hypothetical protein
MALADDRFPVGRKEETLAPILPRRLLLAPEE